MSDLVPVPEFADSVRKLHGQGFVTYISRSMAGIEISHMAVP